jgi:hypothetical protein
MRDASARLYPAPEWRIVAAMLEVPSSSDGEGMIMVGGFAPA